MLKVAKTYSNSDSGEGKICRNLEKGIDNTLEYDYLSNRYFLTQIRHSLCLSMVLESVSRSPARGVMVGPGGGFRQKARLGWERA
jgi:hypothetical protein